MKYTNRIVLFLDILGFRKIVADTVDKSSSGETDNIEKITSLDHTLRKMGGIAGVDNTKRNNSIVVTQFSDSIVISFSENEPEKSAHIFRTILDIIVFLATESIICRGAMSYGKLIHNDRILFGPALVDAYETETKAAMYPRVIMDKNIYDFSRGYNDPNENQLVFADIRRYLSQDVDGKYYIDYFNAPLRISGNRQTTVDYYKSLREIIKGGTRFLQPDLKVKYGWMKGKYNLLLNDLKKDSNLNPKSITYEYLSSQKVLK